MISEGSCETEDWSKDVENSALPHWNELYFKVYNDVYSIKKALF